MRPGRGDPARQRHGGATTWDERPHRGVRWPAGHPAPQPLVVGGHRRHRRRARPAVPGPLDRLADRRADDDGGEHRGDHARGVAAPATPARGTPLDGDDHDQPRARHRPARALPHGRHGRRHALGDRHRGPGRHHPGRLRVRGAARVSPPRRAGSGCPSRPASATASPPWPSRRWGPSSPQDGPCRSAIPRCGPPASSDRSPSCSASTRCAAPARSPPPCRSSW